MSTDTPYGQEAQDIYDFLITEEETRSVISDPESIWPAFLSLAFAVGDEEEVLLAKATRQGNNPTSGTIELYTNTRHLWCEFGTEHAPAVNIKPAALGYLRVRPLWEKYDGGWVIRSVQYFVSQVGDAGVESFTHRARPFESDDLRYLRRKLDQLEALLA